MAWHAQLQLNYAFENQRSVARHLHSGPLRVLQSLYPEGDAVCHNVLVHPPGGLVGGDHLALDVRVASGAHGLITTPSATRFYRSAGDVAHLQARLALAAHARLEYLPFETLCYSGCLAENQLLFDLAPGAELMGWDITALGLPQAKLPFEQGRLYQHLEWPGVWLERGVVDAADQRLLQSPLGLNGQRCMATLFFLSGSPLLRERRQQALDTARAVLDPHGLSTSAGATSPNPQVVVVRVLAPLVEPAMQLMQQVWASWRAALWAMAALPPRLWRM